MHRIISAPEQIDLAIPALAGFTDFIGCWCGRVESGFFLVDPGPAATIPTVLEYLHYRNASTLAAILLTHIHVDHAGGVGLLIENFPDTPIVCPARSIRHLIDPSHLATASRTVLGTLMDHYGAILPVPAERIIAAEESSWGSIPTPGHSPDHTAYLVDGYLFCGEALGVICAPASLIYRRPATPPRFEPTPYTTSIARLGEVAAHTACFGHFGSLPLTPRLCTESLGQITHWVASIRDNRESSDQELIAHLTATDPLFGPWNELPETIRQREEIFIANTFAGIRDYLVRHQGF
jgi:glyoxylase-like metal-dependent hydrolase (beta-lactamase superfamily II)